MQKRIKGPATMPKKFKGSNGWSYHPTKGFRRDSGFGARQRYNRGVRALMDWGHAFATPSQW